MKFHNLFLVGVFCFCLFQSNSSYGMSIEAEDDTVCITNQPNRKIVPKIIGDVDNIDILVGPKNGTIRIQPNNKFFQYTPTEKNVFIGRDSVTYIAFDGTNSSTATIIINVSSSIPNVDWGGLLDTQRLK